MAFLHFGRKRQTISLSFPYAYNLVAKYTYKP